MSRYFRYRSLNDLGQASAEPGHRTRFCVSAENYDLNSDDTLESLAAAGAGQLSVSYDILMQEGVTCYDIQALRGRLASHGLFAVTSHPPFGSFNEEFSTLRQDREGRARDLDWMEEFIHRCGWLGVSAVPLHTGGAMLPGSKPWEILLAQRYVERLLPVARRANVVIAIENTNHATPIDWYEGVREIVTIDKNVWRFDDTQKILNFVHGFDSPFVKICYDTGHSHLLGKVLPDLAFFLCDIVLYHLHDNDGAGNDAHVQPGYGNTPWREVFALASLGQSRAPMLIEAGPRFGSLPLMIAELDAIMENKVVYMPGGFLKKDEDTGRIMVIDGVPG